MSKMIVTTAFDCKYLERRNTKYQLASKIVRADEMIYTNIEKIEKGELSNKEIADLLFDIQMNLRT